MPRHAAGDRVDGELHRDAALLQLVVQLAHLVLGLRHRHAVARDDDDQARLLEDLRRAFDRLRLVAPSARPPRLRCCTCPNAPNSTLVNERFIALHMMIDRIRPLEPSSAPAVISSLLSSTKPIATADRPAYAFRIEITVGMSAPPIGMISSTPNSSASTMISREQHRRPGRGRIAATSSDAEHQRQRAAAPRLIDVLARVGDRPLRDPLDLLQLAGGHQAAGERQVAEHDLDDDRDHAEGREVLRLLRQPEIVLRPCRPGRPRARRRRARARSAAAPPSAARATAACRRRSPATIASDDPDVVDDLRLRPGREDGERHAGDAGVHALGARSSGRSSSAARR